MIDLRVKKNAHQVLGTTVFAALISLFVGTSQASEDIPDVLMSPLIDEFRLGVLNSDLGQGEDGVNLNAEILFRRPNVYYNNRLLLFLLNPRIHIGGSLNTAGDTSQVYAGLTYDYRLTNNLFVEASIGGVIHDGNVNKTVVAGANRRLGCRTMFRHSLSAGYEFTENLRFMITFDTINNYELCSENAGLSSLGARIGYKF